MIQGVGVGLGVADAAEVTVTIVDVDRMVPEAGNGTLGEVDVAVADQSPITAATARAAAAVQARRRLTMVGCGVWRMDGEEPGVMAEGERDGAA